MNKVGSCAQKFHRCDKILIGSHITTYISSYLNIYPGIRKARSRVSTTRRFYFTWHFCFCVLWNQYISKMSNLYNPDKKIKPSISNNMWPHVSDPKSDHTFIFFGYVPGLYFFLILCGNFPVTSKTGRCWNLLKFDSRLNQIYPGRNIISWPIQNGNTEPNPRY